MLSGLRGLEFLGSQGVTAFGNLVLSRQDSLLLDVRSTVPAEEVAWLRYAALPSSSGLFPTPLLESALVKICTASNDALVQKTLHPPKIPRKSSGGPSQSRLVVRLPHGAAVAEAGSGGLFLFHSPAGLEAEGAQGQGALFVCFRQLQLLWWQTWWCQE